MGKNISILRNGLKAFALLVTLFVLTSCEQYAYMNVTDPDQQVSFQGQVQPIFTAKCITCHKGSRNPDLREGNSYASLTSGGFVTKPAEDSRLYRQVTSQGHTSLTTDVQKQIILNWIDQGALNN
ncbi:MAG: hypothetical protein WCE64_10210 [Bacteroidales bacterium]